jgi:DNA-binding MarR family transcriptional regulator
MTVMIDKLIRKGLVQRNRSEKDRRIVLVSLSEKGEKAHKEYDRLHHKVTKVWLEALSEEEQQQLVVILQKVSQALSS